MSKKCYITAEIEIPRVPNFFRMTDGNMIPISAIKDESLREIAEEWEIALIERAAEQRKAEKSGEDSHD